MSRTDLLIDGIRLGTASAGIRQTTRDDIAVIAISSGSKTAAVFTQNRFCAAPVQLAKAHLETTSPKLLLINSGNANAGTGDVGFTDCEDSCRHIADLYDCRIEQILPFSTGVIGERMPVEKFKQAMPSAISDLKPEGWEQAAKAIMTTDTQEKMAVAECVIDGQLVSVQGIAKGSGMIHPNMATMLAFIATDAVIDQEILQACLQTTCDRSFNRVSVDGDTSTNDACVLIATGRSNSTITDQNRENFQQALDEVSQQLAQAIVKDGEGATKFITVQVNGGKSTAECLEVAFTIAHSPLVKTAFFASDPNWGRLLAAVGRAKIEELAITGISISLDDVRVIEAGEPAADYTEAKGAEVMKKDEITVTIDLSRGEYSDKVWTCDFSYDYVKINAEYRT